MAKEKEVVAVSEEKSTLKKLDEILDCMLKMAQRMNELTQETVEVEKDGKKTKVDGPMWKLIKRAKGIGAF